nr:DNA polymerase III subunit gamma/tau [bacterium]
YIYWAIITINMSWYRKYRPRAISQLHLTSVREMLSSYLEQGELPQVFLFSGQKGTGKTSTARILAAILNDPINEKQVLDVFRRDGAKKSKLSEPTTKSAEQEKIFNGTSYLVRELDAASNRGIDDIRALREQVVIPLHMGSISVYILDEVHMLTTEAFNALLKLLEEPPAHVVFILATTEHHKVPGTIVSRSTVVPFKRATVSELDAALRVVADAEKIEYDATALQDLALLADGSFRDAIKLLEQFTLADKKLTSEAFTGKGHLPFTESMSSLIKAVTSRDATSLVILIESLRHSAIVPAVFYKMLLDFLHTDLLTSLAIHPGTAQWSTQVSKFFLQELKSLPTGSAEALPFLELELKLLDMVFRAMDKDGTPAKIISTPATVKKSPPAQTATNSIIEVKASTEPSELPAHVANVIPIGEGDSSMLIAQWEQFLELVRAKNSSLAALLRSARPVMVSREVAQIAVFYQFHKDQLQQPKFFSMIQECVAPIAGGTIGLEFTIIERESSKSKIVTDLQLSSDTTDLSALAELALI